MGDQRSLAGADAALNRALWTQINADFTDEDAERAWSAEEVSWGLFKVPDRELGVLGDVADLDVVELGCGTAYLSAWLARRGARPVGVDVTPAQLATARRCQERFGLSLPPGRGRRRGRALARRQLRPGRERVRRERLVRSRPMGRRGGPAAAAGWAAGLPHQQPTRLTMCVPADGGFAGDSLLRPQREARRVRWPGGGVEFHPGHGDWIGVLRSQRLHGGGPARALRSE